MIKPLHNRLLIEKIELPKVTAGGLHTPDNVQTTMCVGRVLERAEDADAALEQGAIIIFGQFAGIEVPTPGKVRFLIQDKEILAITTLEEMGIEEGEQADG